MIKFKNFTIESFVMDSVLAPIQDIFMMTSRQFLNKYIMSPTKQFCQLQDQITLLHKVFFLQGVSIQKFATNTFEQIDQDSQLMHGHWYIINANFQEALQEQLSCSLPNLSKARIFSNMSVTKEEKVARQYLKSSTDVLKLIKIQYASEWPLEIVIDKSTIIKKYNIILRLLLQVKYAKYVMEKRDYHLKRPNLLRYSHSYSFGRKK